VKALILMPDMGPEIGKRLAGLKALWICFGLSSNSGKLLDAPEKLNAPCGHLTRLFL